MTPRARFCAFALVALVVVACQRSTFTPTAPTPPTTPTSAFVGTWSGTISDNGAGAGAIELIITRHTAISLFGTWRATFADASLDGDGTLNGAADGSFVSLTLTYSTPRECLPLPPTRPLLGVNLVADGAQMSGSFFGLSCGPLRGGKVDLTRR